MTDIGAIAAIFLPSLGVLLELRVGRNFCLINILSTVCGYFPGWIHHLGIVGKN
ncbi:YqaE/Pmp3 family membrane protein [Microcoleus sp. FACHB-672]|nr:YqaE/Pmp3 family membrane protein [Microcoleus sp. FACHB-672]